MSTFPTASLPAPGSMNVDWEDRFDPSRLRAYRLVRARAALESSDLGAVLLFDMNNIRYVTSTTIGEWARDKLMRWALLTRTGGPYLWDFGSAARKNRIHAPWLEDDEIFGGMNGLRGAVRPEAGLFKRTTASIVDVLRKDGVADMPLGVDVIELPMHAELVAAGLTVRDGQQTMLDAREIKSRDEILLLTTAASMVDGVYQDIFEALKPGVRENDIVALANKRLYEMGSDDVEGINAISGERCSPHPHVFSDRMIRPGDQAYFDILHAFNGYRTCYYRTFAVGRATQPMRDAFKKAREWMDASIDLVKPGVTTAEIASVWPRAQEFGFDDEYECFGLQFGHGLGLGLHERPIISRLNSLDDPVEIKTGMVFALETYCPSTDGRSAARIEEEIVVTETGHEVITLFPCEELLVANAY
jgi:Xaa-Pro aminopeptidase